MAARSGLRSSVLAGVLAFWLAFCSGVLGAGVLPGVLAFWRSQSLAFWRSGVLVGVLAFWRSALWRSGVLAFWRSGVLQRLAFCPEIGVLANLGSSRFASRHPLDMSVVFSPGNKKPLGRFRI